jgi:hypothetical protein
MVSSELIGEKMYSECWDLVGCSKILSEMIYLLF